MNRKAARSVRERLASLRRISGVGAYPGRLGIVKGRWVPHDTRDAIVDYMNAWAEMTELPIVKLLLCAEVPRSSFATWRERYGKVNEHNGQIPRDHWLDPEEREAIIAYHNKNPPRGLSPLDLHDARRGSRRSQSIDGLQGPQDHWPSRSLQAEALTKG